VNDNGVRIVVAWHEALNAGDADRLIDLSHPDVEMGGPRGRAGEAARGAGLLREWVARANIRLEPRRVFQREETVVIEEAAEWRSPDTEVIIGSQTVASVFVVRGGRVTSVVRHEDLTSALTAANLDESYETKMDRGST
jgi:ketosteroid isomerase-like protein